MPSPIPHPSAWKGTELFAQDCWNYDLSESDIAELKQALALTKDSPMESITKESFVLPKLGARLASIQDSLENGAGACMIRKFPIKKYPLEQARRIYWGIARHIGTPVSQSASGEKMFAVRDSCFGSNDPRSRGPNTAKKLSFHTDRCDVISFLCWRQAREGGDNQVVSSVTLYNEILRRRPDLLEILMQPFAYKRHSVDTGNQQTFCRQPVFSVCRGYFAGSFLRVLIDRADADPDLPNLTRIQREALDYLEALAAEPALHVTFLQHPGDLLFLNNWVTFHRRTAFIDHEEKQQRRCLFRLWLSPPNSRPLDQSFATNFGSIEAGAVRGGMNPEKNAVHPPDSA